MESNNNPQEGTFWGGGSLHSRVSESLFGSLQVWDFTEYKLYLHDLDQTEAQIKHWGETQPCLTGMSRPWSQIMAPGPTGTHLPMDTT